MILILDNDYYIVNVKAAVSLVGFEPTTLRLQVLI